MIIDAKDLVLGRLATFAAKQALLGETIQIVNCSEALVTGEPKAVIKRYREKRKRGSMAKGPFMPRMTDRFVRRAIRGMLPYKQEKGKLAFKRIMCHRGVPKEFEGKQFVSLDNAHAKKLSTTTVSVGEICKKLGGSA